MDLFQILRDILSISMMNCPNNWVRDKKHRHFKHLGKAFILCKRMIVSLLTKQYHYLSKQHIQEFYYQMRSNMKCKYHFQLRKVFLLSINTFIIEYLKPIHFCMSNNLSIFATKSQGMDKKCKFYYLVNEVYHLNKHKFY